MHQNIVSLIAKKKLLNINLHTVYGNEKENWRILTNKDIYARVKKPTTGRFSR